MTTGLDGCSAVLLLRHVSSAFLNRGSVCFPVDLHRYPGLVDEAGRAPAFNVQRRARWHAPSSYCLPHHGPVPRSPPAHGPFEHRQVFQAAKRCMKRAACGSEACDQCSERQSSLACSCARRQDCETSSWRASALVRSKTKTTQSTVNCCPLPWQLSGRFAASFGSRQRLLSSTPRWAPGAN